MEPQPLLEPLTEREVEIISCLIDGLNCMYSESLGQKRVQVNGGFSPAYYIL